MDVDGAEGPRQTSISGRRRDTGMASAPREGHFRRLVLAGPGVLSENSIRSAQTGLTSMLDGLCNHTRPYEHLRRNSFEKCSFAQRRLDCVSKSISAAFRTPFGSTWFRHWALSDAIAPRSAQKVPDYPRRLPNRDLSGPHVTALELDPYLPTFLLATRGQLISPLVPKPGYVNALISSRSVCEFAVHSLVCSYIWPAEPPPHPTGTTRTINNSPQDSRPLSAAAYRVHVSHAANANPK